MVSSPILAHHALEYISLESATIARFGEAVFHLHYDYMIDDVDDPQKDHWEVTPGLAYGLLPGVMADVHTHFAQFGNHLIAAEKQSSYAPGGPSPFLEALAASVQFSIPTGTNFKTGAALTYEFPFQRSRDLLDGEEVFAGTIILSRELAQHRNLTVNYSRIKDGDSVFSEGGIGIRSPLTADEHGVAAGLEFLAANEGGSTSWTVLPGIYLPIGYQSILKTGLEFDEDGNATHLNLTFMTSF